jgi:prepilin-type processing-associated H-X9-DG protein
MKQLALATAMYVQDFDEKFPCGYSLETPTILGANVTNLDGWATQIFPDVKSTGVYGCPDDATTATLPAVKISYAMNANCTGGVALATFVSTTSSVLLFEVSGITGDPTNTSNVGLTGITGNTGLAGASGNGTPNPAVSSEPDSVAGFTDQGALSSGDSAATAINGLYETGNLGNINSIATPNAYDSANAGGGLHSGGANYAYIDSHVKWALPTSISAGASNVTGSSDTGNSCANVTCTSGWTSAPVLFAAGTSASNLKAGTFSLN